MKVLTLSMPASGVRSSLSLLADQGVLAASSEMLARFTPRFNWCRLLAAFVLVCTFGSTLLSGFDLGLGALQCSQQQLGLSVPSIRV